MRPVTTHSLAAAIAVALALAMPALAAPADEAQAVLDAVRAEAPIPALSAAVWTRADGAAWSAASGQANLELDVPVTPEHRFRLGSVSKVITASLAAHLADAGLVDLDRPISDYMPDLPEQHRATTLTQLLSHQGGVRHYGRQDFDFSGPGGLIDLRPAYPTTVAGLDLFINDPLVAEPGTQYNYSTFGYSLAAAVMEAATGVSFAELLHTYVSEPLGLESLALDEPYSLRTNRVAYYDLAYLYAEQMGLTVEGDVVNALPNNPSYKWAGGGMIASAEDLARFGGAHLGSGYLGQDAYQQAFTVQLTADGEATPVGLGWRIDHDEQGRLRYHQAGTQQGARALVLVYPEQGVAVALLSNLGGTPEDILTPAAQIAEAFMH